MDNLMEWLVLKTSSLPDKNGSFKFLFSYFSAKSYVVDTQKNRHSVTVLLSTKNICQDIRIRK